MQSVSSTTGWIFICQGKTKVMFQWGIYSSLTTVASFIVGLHWCAVGDAAAYAISGYVLRVPVLAVLVHRVGPVTAGDFLIMQGLFIVSSLLAWGAYLALPDTLIGQSNLLALALATGLNYGLALVLMLVFRQPRRMLFSTFAVIARNIG
jgi:hypothetical protein